MNWATRLYTLLLRLYPTAFREAFEEEMTAVFTQAMMAAAAQGRWAATAVALALLINQAAPPGPQGI